MPEWPQQVVVNATPLIALALIGKLDLLQQLYGQVIVPSAVEAEVFAGGPRGIGSIEIQEATWLHTVSLQDPHLSDVAIAEVLELADKVQA